MPKNVPISLFHEVLTFIELHDLLIIIMFFFINIKSLKTLRLCVNFQKLIEYSKISPIMYSCSNTLGSAMQIYSLEIFVDATIWL